MDHATTKTTAPKAKAPQCSIHGEMVRVEAHTPEQKFCGEWFRCPRCASSVLRPSPELKAQTVPAKYSAAAREIAAYEADIYKAKRNARVAKKQRGATKAQLAHRAKLFAPASPSIHDDVAAIAASIAGALKSAGGARR